MRSRQGRIRLPPAGEALARPGDPEGVPAQAPELARLAGDRIGQGNFNARRVFEDGRGCWRLRGVHDRGCSGARGGR